jgi:hypothetical protein
MPAIKVFLLVALLFFTGCDRVGDLTDNIARSRIFDIGATEYDLEMSRSDINALERSLAMNIYPMDTQLNKLMRRLAVRDSYPPGEWKEGLLSEFYWLNEIVIMDKDKSILSRHPETSIKKLTYEPAFPKALSLGQGRVMLAIEDTPLGSEVLMASSVFEGFELTGLILVNFDPRTFISLSNAPQEIILVTAHEVVWTGKFDHLLPHLNEIEWESLVSKKIRGKLKLQDDEFFWFARAVGEDWLIYLVKDD